MSEQVPVSTRKGLFTFTRGDDGAWAQSEAKFLGDNVTLSDADARVGCWYAALDHGHFGVKLHRSEDRGQSWTEIAVPEYPPNPKASPPPPTDATCPEPQAHLVPRGGRARAPG